MSDIMNQITTELANKIQVKKMEIIKAKLKELGFEDSIPTKRTRFSKIVCEIHENEEVWYVDNGTDDGLRVVTFASNKSLDYKGDMGTKIEIELNYY